MIRRPPRSTLFPTRRSSDLKSLDPSWDNAMFNFVFDSQPAEIEFTVWDWDQIDRKSTRLNSSHVKISYAVFCLKKKKKQNPTGKAQSVQHDYIECTCQLTT